MTDVRPIDTTSTVDALKVPVNASNEQVIIGAALAGWDDGACDNLLRIFGPDHFLAAEHAAFWGIVREMKLRKLGWDPATARIVGAGVFDDNMAGLVASICQLRGVETPENLDFHVKQMLWDRAKATAIQGPIAALLDGVHDPKSEPDRVHAISKQITAALSSGERKHLRDSNQLVNDMVAQIRARADRQDRYAFGLEGLDYFESHEAAKVAGIANPEEIAGPDGRVRRMMPGAEPGYITLVSGQSGGGKTALACALTISLARKKRRVLYAAWEPKDTITLEALAIQSLGWSRTRSFQGLLTEEQIVELEGRSREIVKYVRFMSKAPFYDFSGSKKKRTNEQNLDIFASYVADSGCDVVVADLWKYCLVSQKPEEEEEALKRQQAMCEDQKFHLFLLQQQAHKREDKRADNRPSREGVKGSGAYLEIADNVLAPNIPSKWQPLIPADRFEVYVLKQRYGRWPLGIQFNWNSESGVIGGGRTIPYEFDAKGPDGGSGQGNRGGRRARQGDESIEQHRGEGDDEAEFTPVKKSKGGVGPTSSGSHH